MDDKELTKLNDEIQLLGKRLSGVTESINNLNYTLDDILTLLKKVLVKKDEPDQNDHVEDFRPST